MKLKFSAANKENIKAHFTVVVLYTFITIILTFPLILRMNNWLPMGDPAFNTWVLAWDVHSLTTDPLNLFNTNIFYPFTNNTLALSEHLFADMLVALPVIMITHNPILAYNLILFLSFVLSGYGMFLLIKYYTKDKYSAFVGGVIFAFCTIRFAHIPHLQLLTAQWMPFALLYLDKFLHRGNYRNLVLLYVFYILQVLSSWYLAFYTTISLAVYALGIFILNKKVRKNLSCHSYILKLVLFIICTIAVVAPFAIPYIQVAQEYGFVRNLDEINSLSADVGDYFLTPPNNLVYGKLSAGFQANRNWVEHSLFPGISVIILVLYGTLCIKKLKIGNLNKFGLVYIGGEKLNIYVFILFVSFILSLGYPLHFFGHIINIDLPYRFLYDYLPGFKSMRVPSRFGIIVMLSLSVLAGYGLNRLIKFRNYKFIISSLIVLFILVENLYIPFNFETTPSGREIPEVYKWLANETGGSSIVELPTGYFTKDGNNLWYDSRYLYYSAYHWKYLVNGYSGFFPVGYFDILRSLQTFPSNDSINILQIIRVNYLVVHMNEIDPKMSASIKENISNYSKSIQLIKIFNNDYVYKVSEINMGNKSLTNLHPMADWRKIMHNVSFRAHSGQYVCAYGGGGRDLVANRNNVGPWETFELIDLGNNGIALRADGGQYVSARGGRQATANNSSVGQWETFGLIDLGYNNVALRAYNGEYVSTEDEDEHRLLVVNRSIISERETFKMEGRRV